MLGIACARVCAQKCKHHTGHTAGHNARCCFCCSVHFPSRIAARQALLRTCRRACAAMPTSSSCYWCCVQAGIENIGNKIENPFRIMPVRSAKHRCRARCACACFCWGPRVSQSARAPLYLMHDSRPRRGGRWLWPCSAEGSVRERCCSVSPLRTSCAAGPELSYKAELGDSVKNVDPLLATSSITSSRRTAALAWRD